MASVGLCFTLVASAHSAPPAASAERAERVAPAGEGVICAWAIYTVMATVGSKCFPGENVSFQSGLRSSVDRLDAYVQRNGKDFTPERVMEFKRRQGHTDTPAQQLCRGEAVQMYRAFEKADQSAMKAGLDKVLGRDGPPTWGTCL